MHAGGSRELRDALDGALHVVLGHHHKVGHFIDDHEDIRVWCDLAFGACGRMHLASAHGSVEVLDVAESEEFEVAVSCVHLLDHPFQSLRGLLRIGDDRGEQMWNARIGGQFDSFRIDHDHADLVRRGAHDHGGEHGVDEARLAGAGGASHQQVGHLGQVGGHEMAFHILADAGEHRIRIVPGLVGAQHVAQHHGFAIGVRNFDADGGFAFDHRQDAHVGAGHRVGDVLLQVGDLLDLDARAKLHLIHGDGWSAQEADDLRIDVELLEGTGQRADHTIVLRSVRGVRRALLQNVEVRQMIRSLGNVIRRFPVNGSSRHIVKDLAGRGIHHDFLAVGGAVLVDDGPWVAWSDANRLDFAGRHRLGDAGHGAARGADRRGREGASATVLWHGRGAGRCSGGIII